ncbi:unnamed protein product [Ectocarpus sp. 13 AM-2016]
MWLGMSAPAYSSRGYCCIVRGYVCPKRFFPPPHRETRSRNDLVVPSVRAPFHPYYTGRQHFVTRHIYWYLHCTGPTWSVSTCSFRSSLTAAPGTVECYEDRMDTVACQRATLSICIATHRKSICMPRGVFALTLDSH